MTKLVFKPTEESPHDVRCFLCGARKGLGNVIWSKPGKEYVGPLDEIPVCMACSPEQPDYKER